MVPLLPHEFNSFVSIEYCKKVYSQLSKLLPFNLEFYNALFDSLVQKHKSRKKNIKENIETFKTRVEDSIKDREYIFGVDKWVVNLIVDK